MKQDTANTNCYYADEGMVIILKGDTINEETNQYDSQTDSIWIGKFDSIDNYEEVEKPAKTSMSSEENI